MNYGDYAHPSLPAGMFQFFPDPNIRAAPRSRGLDPPVVPKKPAHMALRIAIHVSKTDPERLSRRTPGDREYLMKERLPYDGDAGAELGYAIDSSGTESPIHPVLRGALARLTPRRT